MAARNPNRTPAGLQERLRRGTAARGGIRETQSWRVLLGDRP